MYVSVNGRVFCKMVHRQQILKVYDNTIVCNFNKSSYPSTPPDIVKGSHLY